MIVYQRGSKGEEVARIQRRLKDLGHYAGPEDGIFGGGTESAVRAFQQARRLAVDGRVGPKSWAALFDGATIERPAILGESLGYRCLALTGSFETTSGVPDCFAGLSGDFDGQGISFGALQWNFGQGSLQPLLQEMDRSHPRIVEQVFGDHVAELRAVLKMKDRREQVAWARSIQDLIRFRVAEPWRGFFKTLGRRTEFQQIQVRAAERLRRAAIGLCKTYGVWSERAAALLFDILVQNGSISDVVRARIEREFGALPRMGKNAAEVARLQIIANRRAEAANPRWVEDVRTRKLTIANGTGTVHGHQYDLEAQYGIRLRALG